MLAKFLISKPTCVVQQQEYWKHSVFGHPPPQSEREEFTTCSSIYHMFVNLPSFEREERLAENLRGRDPLVLDIGAMKLEGSTQEI